MTGKEQFNQPWKAFAKRWEKYYTPPGRPSKQAINVYRKYAKEALKGLRRKPRGLIFGATPELRDLLTEMKFEVTIIDINMEMILAMSELTKKKNPEEIIIKSNWLASPLASNYYDVVLGDLVLSNIIPERQAKFLNEIIRILKSKGYWITRFEVVPNDWPFDDFNNLLNKFSKIPWHKNRPMELLFLLLNNAWNPKTNIGYLRRVKSWMEKYKVKEGKYKHPNEKVTKCLNLIWEMWKPMEKQWVFRREKDTVKQLLPYFKIIKKIVLNDCYYRQADESAPIWVCQVEK